MPTTSDQALYTVLSAHSGLAALISDRIFSVEAPQGTPLPMLVFQPTGGQSAATHGEGSSDSRLDGVNYQVTAIALTPEITAEILYQARLAIEASTSLRGIQISPERALPRSDMANAHGRMADFLVWNRPDA